MSKLKPGCLSIIQPILSFLIAKAIIVDTFVHNFYANNFKITVLRIFQSLIDNSLLQII